MDIGNDGELSKKVFKWMGKPYVLAVILVLIFAVIIFIMMVIAEQGFSKWKVYLIGIIITGMITVSTITFYEISRRKSDGVNNKRTKNGMTITPAPNTFMTSFRGGNKQLNSQLRDDFGYNYSTPKTHYGGTNNESSRSSRSSIYSGATGDTYSTTRTGLSGSTRRSDASERSRYLPSIKGGKYSSHKNRKSYKKEDSSSSNEINDITDLFG